MSFNIDKRIDHLIICLNDVNTSGKKGDSLKMRNISNFYERCRNGRYGEINEKDLIKKLIKKKYKIKMTGINLYFPYYRIFFLIEMNL